MGLFALFLPGPAAIAATSVTGTAQAKIKVSDCQGGALYADRQLAFRSTMKSIGAGGHLQMRFVIQRRYQEQRRFHVVTPNDTPQGALAEWFENSNPAATSFVYNYVVTPVETRAQYRARIYFRWRNAAGKIVKRAKRVSSVCNQRRKLPNLSTTSVAKFANSGAGFPQMPVRYELTVKNNGGSSAATFLTAGDLNGVALASEPAATTGVLDFLAAGASTVVVLYGPECRPGEKLAITLNTDRSVRESRYEDDASVHPCGA